MNVRRLGFVVTFVAGVLVSPATHAVTVVVPDDVPTIQAAIDATPDTVVVRSGDYAETPVLTRDLVLLGEGPTRPRTDGFRILIPEQLEQVVIEDVHFTGPFELHTTDEVNESFVFRRCVFDQGWNQSVSDIADVIALEFTDCRISGAFAPYAMSHFTFVGNEVDGPVTLVGERLHEVLVHNNDIHAGAPSPGTGLAIITEDRLEGTIESNRISGFVQGIWIPSGDDVRVLGNRVVDCSGIGIRVDTRKGVLDGNEVLRSLEGMNVRGMNLEVSRNVLGHSVGAGLHAASLEWSWRIRHNTLYANGGSGIVLEGIDPAATVLVDHNIGFGNGSWGIEGVPATGVTLACNDWFANSSGASSPNGPGATDRAVDPGFCSVASDDVRLREDSPLADAAGCGLIGAREVGCGATAGVGPVSTLAFALEPVAPNPTRGDARFAFRLAREAAIELDVLDVQGRLVARLAHGRHAAGAHEVRWDRGATSPGLYLVRLRHPEATISRRFVLIR
jgi:hypothetical protein